MKRLIFIGSLFCLLTYTGSAKPPPIADQGPIQKNSIKVSGAVKIPGLVPYKDGITVKQAIAAAGGRGKFAAKTAYLIRNGKRFKFDLTRPDHQNLKVYPKDEIIIPSLFG